MLVNRTTSLSLSCPTRADLTKARADEALAHARAVLVESLAKRVRPSGTTDLLSVSVLSAPPAPAGPYRRSKIPAGCGVALRWLHAERPSPSDADTANSLWGTTRVVVPHAALLAGRPARMARVGLTPIVVYVRPAPGQAPCPKRRPPQPATPIFSVFQRVVCNLGSRTT